MNIDRVNDILRNKEKVDVYCDNRVVFIQDNQDKMATVGFVDNFEQKIVDIRDLYER